MVNVEARRVAGGTRRVPALHGETSRRGLYGPVLIGEEVGDRLEK